MTLVNALNSRNLALNFFCVGSSVIGSADILTVSVEKDRLFDEYAATLSEM